MITEDYVSFEVAKLLKEKGFNEYCRTYYTNSRIGFHDIYNSPRLIDNKSLFEMGLGLSAPTLQMAMKWLREVHNISIEVVYDCSNDKTGTISWWLADIKHINSGSSKENDCLTAYNSYEEACEAACIYVLKNLI